MKILKDVDFNHKMAKNLVLDKVSGYPTSPTEGQIGYDTVTKLLATYNGTVWVPNRGSVPFDTPMRISGDGYFLVVDPATMDTTRGRLFGSTTAMFYLTNDTSFYTDLNGLLVNSSGYYLCSIATVTGTGSLQALQYDSVTLEGAGTNIRAVYNDIDFALPGTNQQYAVKLTDFLTQTITDDIGASGSIVGATVGSLLRVTAGTLTQATGTNTMWDMGFVASTDATTGTLNHTSSIHIARATTSNNRLVSGNSVNISPVTRKLYNSSSAATVDWENRQFLSAYWSAITDINFGTYTIVGSSNTFTLIPTNGKIQRVTMTANSTLNGAAGSFDGQTIILEVLSSGGAYQLTMTTGSTNNFLFGSILTAIAAGVSGKTQVIGVRWNAAANRWWVVSCADGF